VLAFFLQVAPTLSEAQSQQLYGLFNTYVDAGLAWVRQHGKEYISSVNNNLTTTLCAILQVSVSLCSLRCCSDMPLLSLAMFMRHTRTCCSCVYL
jgi:hypothetical protein